MVQTDRIYSNLLDTHTCSTFYHFILCSILVNKIVTKETLEKLYFYEFFILFYSIQKKKLNVVLSKDICAIILILSMKPSIGGLYQYQYYINYANY